MKEKEGSLKVVIERDGENDFMKFVFPDEDDRLYACYRLATYASGKWNYYPDSEPTIGFLRDTFFGTSIWKLFEIRTYANRPMMFVFRESAMNSEKLLVTLNGTSERRIEIIIKD